MTAPGKIEPRFDEARGFTGLEEATKFVQDQAGRHDGLIQGMLAPDLVKTCAMALLVVIMDTARGLDVPVRLRIAQGEMERDTVAALHDTTAPKWLAGFGALSDQLIAPHATVATDTDLQRYVDHGVTMARIADDTQTETAPEHLQRRCAGPIWGGSRLEQWPISPFLILPMP
ncbi:amidohydrolase family protein [Cypionkella psychrotolerans]|uniref:hypothetical protein n=1 Tax=Cypionkella psychrotolerans TaxID=1678131 RepID=UPI000AE523F5|nr:hypothetical protein [Cypionkella psychrotolerans]